MTFGKALVPSCALFWFETSFHKRFCHCCMCRFRILLIGSSDSSECLLSSHSMTCIWISPLFDFVFTLFFLSFWLVLCDSHKGSLCSLILSCLLGICTGGGNDNRFSCKGSKTPLAVPLKGSSGSP